MHRTVTLVDESNNALGEAVLEDAHIGKGKLHRAISVYVLNAERTMILLQQRSSKKPLFAGIWANTCCSHPFANESAKEAGERRLLEEMNLRCALREHEGFVYRAEDPNGKGVEHEYDIILTGTADPALPLNPDPREVAEWKWMKIDALQKDMKEHPDIYAPWFHLGLPKALSSLSHD